MNDKAERFAQKITAIIGFESLMQVRLNRVLEPEDDSTTFNHETLDTVRFRIDEIHGAAADLLIATLQQQSTREVDMMTVVNAHAAKLVSSLRDLQGDPHISEYIVRKNVDDLIRFAEEIREATCELWKLSRPSE